jgi:hypothetical protein
LVEQKRVPLALGHEHAGRFGGQTWLYIQVETSGHYTTFNALCDFRAVWPLCGSRQGHPFCKNWQHYEMETIDFHP